MYKCRYSLDYAHKYSFQSMQLVIAVLYYNSCIWWKKTLRSSQDSLSAVKVGSTFFSSWKSVHAWCFEAILIANNYTPGSSKGNICVLHTPKSNHKHSVSMVMTLPTVNKPIIIAHCLQLCGLWTPSELQQFWDCWKAYHLKNTNVPGNWVYHPS